jgi:hypothetical protein
MTKKSISSIIERSKFIGYKNVAVNFAEGAKVAYKYEYYNATGVLLVHVAIALADALTIKKGGLKCKGDNHFEVINLIREIIEQDPKAKSAINQLEEIISFKNEVSYSGDIYLKSDIDKLFKHFNRFYNWADRILVS